MLYPSLAAENQPCFLRPPQSVMQILHTKGGGNKSQNPTPTSKITSILNLSCDVRTVIEEASFRHHLSLSLSLPHRSSLSGMPISLSPSLPGQLAFLFSVRTTCWKREILEENIMERKQPIPSRTHVAVGGSQFGQCPCPNLQYFECLFNNRLMRKNRLQLNIGYVFNE